MWLIKNFIAIFICMVGSNFFQDKLPFWILTFTLYQFGLQRFVPNLYYVKIVIAVKWLIENANMANGHI